MISACSCSDFRRELSTLGAIPSSSSWSSLKRFGAFSSAATTSSVQRSPTRARASASGLVGARFTESWTIAAATRHHPPRFCICRMRLNKLRLAARGMLTCNLQVTTLSDIQAAIQGAASAVGPQVVGLRRGSGIVVGPNRILTVAHVLRGEEATVTFADGRTESATLAGLDGNLDLAVLTATTDVEPIAL